VCPKGGAAKKSGHDPGGHQNQRRAEGDSGRILPNILGEIMDEIFLFHRLDTSWAQTPYMVNGPLGGEAFLPDKPAGQNGSGPPNSRSAVNGHRLPFIQSLSDES
jgi:hypothetical protein